MLEQTIMSYFSRHADSLTKNRIFTAVATSTVSRRLINWWARKNYIEPLIEHPTNEKIYALIGKFEKATHSLIPESADRTLESRMLALLKREFETAVNTGQDNNFTRKAKRTLELIGENGLQMALDVALTGYSVGLLKRRVNGGLYLTVMLLQENSDCNQKPRCRGCYAEGDEGKLDYGTLDRVVKEAAELACRYIVLVGGEPLLEMDTTLKLFSANRKMPFVLFTNGTLVNEKYAETAARLGNVATVINIPGGEHTSILMRRDQNAWNYIRQAAEILREHRAPMGFVSTVYQENYEELSSREFIEQMEKLNAVFGLFLGYKDIVGCAPMSDLSLTPEMTSDFCSRVKKVSSEVPVVLINSVEGEMLIGGCLAAKGGATYVKSNGDVAICPRVPQSRPDLNVHNRPLKAILGSEYFRLARSYGRGCGCLAENPDFLSQAMQLLKSGGK
ncbi:MAG: radical SAM/SPASM domain-containing protein [Candidatus Woesearchaeota archaeon]